MDELVRHEEEVHVGTVVAPHEHVRVRKEVVTEQVTISVTLRREVLHVERTPLDVPHTLTPEEAAALDGALAPAPETTEVVLYGEVPVVSTQVVPVERVTLHRDVVADEATVTGPRRVEHVEVERD